MKNKIYKLGKGCENFPVSSESLGPLRSLELRLNKRRVQKALRARKLLRQKARWARWLPFLFPLGLWLLCTGAALLVSRLGN